MSIAHGGDKYTPLHPPEPPEPPHDADAERSVLGSMLMYGPAVDEVRSLLQAEDFYIGAHATVYEAVCRVHDQGRPVDAKLVADDLEQRGYLEHVGGYDLLADLMAKMATPTHAPHHAGIVARRARQRRASAALGRASALALSGDLDAAAQAALNASQIHTDDVVNLSTVAHRRAEFLWPGRIPLGALSLLQGDSDLMKTTVLCDIAARVSTGTPMPDGAKLDGAGGVVMLTAEDDLATTVVPRLLSHGADLRKIVTLAMRRDGAGNVVPLTIPDDLVRLGRAVRAVEAKLVIIDPLDAFIPETIQTNNNASTRRALGPLVDFAQRHGPAVTCIQHFSKDTSRSPKHRGAGSVGFNAAARAVMVVEEHPDDGGLRVLATVIHNLTIEPPKLGYRGRADERYGVGHVHWESGHVDIDTDELLRGRDARLEAPDRDEAVRYLVEALAGGPRPSGELIAHAKRDLGVSEKTVRRASEQLGVTRHADRDPQTGRLRAWRWALASDE